MTSRHRASPSSIPMRPTPEDSTARFVAPAASDEHRRRVLVIGDGETSRQSLVERLRQEGYEVRTIPIDHARMVPVPGFTPDLMIIDAQQPGTTGLQAAYRLRAVTNVPILILGSHSHRVDRLIGQDEYLSKPFQTSELLRRIQTLLRGDEAIEEAATRAAPVPPPAEDLRYGDLVIRPRLRVIERKGVPIELTATEFDLIFLLASHPRQVFSRQQLFARVWRYEDFTDVRTVTVHMSRLRKKVERDPAHPRHLLTVRSVGYKFVP